MDYITKNNIIYKTTKLTQLNYCFSRPKYIIQFCLFSQHCFFTAKEIYQAVYFAVIRMLSYYISTLFIYLSRYNKNSRQQNIISMLRDRKKRQNHQIQCPFKQKFVPYDDQNQSKQLQSNLLNMDQPEKLINCQQINIVSQKYINQRHFIKTQRPYLLLKDKKKYLLNNKENINSKLSLHNLTVNPKNNNMFMSNINMNQSYNKLKKFSSLKHQRPKSVGSLQMNRDDLKILQGAVKKNYKISASKALTLFSQILKNQKIPLQSIKRKNFGQKQNRYKSVNVLANRVLIIQKQPAKKNIDFGVKPKRSSSSHSYRKKRQEDDFELNGWQNLDSQF